jgi:type VI secretion system secreted protein Hcp
VLGWVIVLARLTPIGAIRERGGRQLGARGDAREDSADCGNSRGAAGRLGSLVIAAVVTSAVVAAIAFAASGGSPASHGNPPGNPSNVPAGQVQLGNGPAFPMLAYSWGVSNNGSAQVGGGIGAGKANVQDIAITKATDATTVELLKKVTTGAHYSTVVVTATQPGTSAKLVYQLENVIVTSVALGGSGQSTPTENFTLNFAKVTWTFTDAAGNSTSGSFDTAGA